jgi:7-cyano-7-deazaguanine synthase in queuosine biosynthesis
MSQDYQQVTNLLYQKFSEISEPFSMGNEMVILHRGLKITKKKTNTSGIFIITVEDTSHDEYLPVRNLVLLNALLQYADRSKKIARTAKDCTALA